MEKPNAFAGIAALGQSEKALWTILVAVGGFLGYYATNFLGDANHAHTLATGFDQSVPFSPNWMFAYGGVYTAFLLPVFVVRCEKLFRRVALGFLCVLFASYASFIAFPVTSKGFRPEVSALDTTRFVQWGAALNYTCDPPMNCFPSLHVATIVLASLCAWKADRIVGSIAFVLAFVISVSTLFVKQHYVADVVAGAALAAVSYFVAVHRYDPVALGKSDLEVRYTRWGFAGYVGTYLFAIFGVLGPMYLVGFKPWESMALGGHGTSVANVASETH